MGIVARDKEHRFDVFLLERVKNRGGIAVFVAFVEGQAKRFPVAVIYQKAPAQRAVLLLGFHRVMGTVEVIIIGALTPANLFPAERGDVGKRRACGLCGAGGL